MFDLWKILLANFLTVIGGFFVLVVGQGVIRFVLDPIPEIARLRGEIANLIDTARPPIAAAHYAKMLREIAAIEVVPGEEKTRDLDFSNAERLYRNEFERAEEAADEGAGPRVEAPEPGKYAARLFVLVPIGIGPRSEGYKAGRQAPLRLREQRVRPASPRGSRGSRRGHPAVFTPAGPA